MTKKSETQPITENLALDVQSAQNLLTNCLAQLESIPNIPENKEKRAQAVKDIKVAFIILKRAGGNLGEAILGSLEDLYASRQ